LNPAFSARADYADRVGGTKYASAAGFRSSAADDLWEAVDALIDRAPSLDDLREHRLQLLAERHWVRSGRPVPLTLSAEKAVAAAFALPIPSLLARISSAWDGPMIILKGAELSRRYPAELLRPSGDIDLLVGDAPAAHAALCSAGFVATGDPRRYVGIHHLQPLVWPNVPVAIELHHAPKWVDGLDPPSTSELFRFAVPATCSVEGFQTLAPAAHAVVLAVHAWAHEPLRNLRDLIDIAVLTAEADIAEVDRIARQWGVSHLWRTTHSVMESLFSGGTRPLALRLWARHLEAVRGRTVAESHLSGWLSPFWALPATMALRHSSNRIWDDLRPVPGEAWPVKLSRARLAVQHAAVRRSSHDRMLEQIRLATPPALFLDRIERRRGTTAPDRSRREEQSG
jgi:hypothetical protein